MFKKLTLAVTLMIVLTSIGCVCQSGRPFRMRGGNLCSPCGASCTPCGSACDPAPCQACTSCGPCEQVTPCACEPTACEPAACENVCPCNPCDSGRCFGKIGFGLGGFGSPIVKQGYGSFHRAPAAEMYVTRGPRDFLYDPNASRMR